MNEEMVEIAEEWKESEQNSLDMELHAIYANGVNIWNDCQDEVV